MKKFPIVITRKIALINELLPKVIECENIPITYNGGTFPHYVTVEKITVNNQFVTIYGDGSQYDYIGKKQRFNVNNLNEFDSEGRSDLNHTLNIIIKAFKSTLK
jgi:hypothetical protein